MIKRITFRYVPAEDERLAWVQWLKYHTIDPDTVITRCNDTAGFIEIDTSLYRISFLTFDKSKNPHLREVTIQLEASPLDFPHIALSSSYSDVEIVSPCVRVDSNT